MISFSVYRGGKLSCLQEMYSISPSGGLNFIPNSVLKNIMLIVVIRQHKSVGMCELSVFPSLQHQASTLLKSSWHWHSTHLYDGAQFCINVIM